MLSIAVKHRDTLTRLGYIALSGDQQSARIRKLCDSASHFRSPLAAAQVRERFQPAFGDLLVVEECHCIQGLALRHKLFPETPYK